MTLGQEIEKIRQQRNIPVWHLCNVLNINHETEYDKIKKGKMKLSAYQKIMLVEFFQVYFNGL